MASRETTILIIIGVVTVGMVNYAYQKWGHLISFEQAVVGLMLVVVAVLLLALWGRSLGNLWGVEE